MLCCCLCRKWIDPWQPALPKKLVRCTWRQVPRRTCTFMTSLFNSVSQIIIFFTIRVIVRILNRVQKLTDSYVLTCLVCVIQANDCHLRLQLIQALFDQLNLPSNQRKDAVESSPFIATKIFQLFFHRSYI